MAENKATHWIRGDSKGSDMSLYSSEPLKMMFVVEVFWVRDKVEGQVDMLDLITYQEWLRRF